MLCRSAYSSNEMLLLIDYFLFFYRNNLQYSFNYPTWKEKRVNWCLFLLKVLINATTRCIVLSCVQILCYVADCTLDLF